MSAPRWLARLISWLRAQRQGWRVRRHHGQARWLLQRHPELLHGLPPEADQRLAAFRGLSVNRANRLRLQLDRLMRPVELQQLLLAWLASREPCPTLRDLLSETLTDAPTLLRNPADYDGDVTVCDLGEAQLRWYRAGSPALGAPRRLLLAFSSNANALSMIAPCFLQQIRPFASDVVLVLRDQPHQRNFFAADAGRSLLARILTALHGLLDGGSFPGVLTIGYSGGGFAALVAAEALGADRGVSLGGWPPRLPVPIDAAWLEALRAELPPARPRTPLLLACCAAGSADDVRGTQLAAAIVRGWPRPQPMLQTRAYAGCNNHNLLVELQRRGHALGPVLRDLLVPEGPLPDPPGRSRPARWAPLPAESP